MKPVSTPPARNSGARDDGGQKREVGLRTGDAHAVERAFQARHRLGAVGAEGDHLGKHRVVIGADD